MATAIETPACPDCSTPQVRNDYGAFYCAECDRRNLIERCKEHDWQERDDYPGDDASLDEIDDFVGRRESEAERERRCQIDAWENMTPTQRRAVERQTYDPTW